MGVGGGEGEERGAERETEREGRGEEERGGGRDGTGRGERGGSWKNGSVLQGDCPLIWQSESGTYMEEGGNRFPCIVL